MTRQDHVYATISTLGGISVPPSQGRELSHPPTQGGDFQLPTPREFRMTLDTARWAGRNTCSLEATSTREPPSAVVTRAAAVVVKPWVASGRAS